VPLASPQELVLHPLEPQLEPLEWALSWAGLLPLNQLAGLLEAAFFPAWLAILHHWLSAAPDFDEVTRWYLEWKGRLPQELLDHPRVRAAFATALNMMNAAADGHPLPPPSSLPSAGTGAGAGSVPAWRREVEADAAAGPAGYGKQPPATSAAVASGPEPSLRELVGRYASEAGCEFLPRAGRLHDGLPVYAFGGVSCVVDGARGVIRAQLKDRGWVPVSLERLKAEAQAKAGGG
jgi:tuftelin-interacting protein 11